MIPTRAPGSWGRLDLLARDLGHQGDWRLGAVPWFDARMRGTRTAYDDGTFRIVLCENVLAAVWFDAPTEGQMREFRRASVAMQKDHPAGTALLNLVCDGTPRFMPGVRDEAARLMKERIHKLGSAHVVLVDGLRGSATRAFLTTAILVGRPRAPARVFAELAPAVTQVHAWLARGAATWSLADLGAFCETAIRRIASTATRPA